MSSGSPAVDREIDCHCHVFFWKVLPSRETSLSPAGRPLKVLTKIVSELLGDYLSARWRASGRGTVFPLEQNYSNALCSDLPVCCGSVKQRKDTVLGLDTIRPPVTAIVIICPARAPFSLKRYARLLQPITETSNHTTVQSVPSRPETRC